MPSLCVDIELKPPFVRLTYAEAMAKYGSDKPDLRFGLEFQDLTEVTKTCQFKVFRGAADAGGQLKAIRLPGFADKVEPQAARPVARSLQVLQHHKGLAWLAYSSPALRWSGIDKHLSPEEMEAIGTIGCATRRCVAAGRRCSESGGKCARAFALEIG